VLPARSGSGDFGSGSAQSRVAPSCDALGGNPSSPGSGLVCPDNINSAALILSPNCQLVKSVALLTADARSGHGNEEERFYGRSLPSPSGWH